MYVTRAWLKSSTISFTVPSWSPARPHTEAPIMLETLCEEVLPPVTGTEGVLVVMAWVGASVGASVAILVLVASIVGGGALVLGTLVGVAGAPQAASSIAARTSVVRKKLTLLILTKLLSFHYHSSGLIFFSR